MKQNGRHPWQNRIVGAGEEAPDQLLANPLNYRIHPSAQQEALAGSLDTIGWVQQVVVNLSYERELEAMRTWIAGNAASRHIFYVAGRGAASHIPNVAEQLSISTALARKLMAGPGAFDLAPTLDDAARLPWEIIGWPIPLETRYKIGSIYGRRMAL